LKADIDLMRMFPCDKNMIQNENLV